MNDELLNEIINKIISVIKNNDYENLKSFFNKTEYDNFIKEEENRIQKEIQSILVDYDLTYEE